MFSKRSSEKELLDLGSDYFTPKEYRECLIELDRIGDYLGGNRATKKAIKRITNCPESILDVGCGGGGMARSLACSFPHAKVRGIDISEEAIEIARSRTEAGRYPNLEFSRHSRGCLQEEDHSFDLVVTSLVCHHMTEEEIREFLAEALRVCRRGVVINDLHRHPLAYYSFGLLSKVFFRNRLIQHDGLISIKRGFTRQEWKRYLSTLEATGVRFKITWNWAFRWIITLTP